MGNESVTGTDFLENFIVENQYGKSSKVPWPHKAISLCKIVCDGNTAAINKIHRNDDHLHAEERLIEDLQEDTNVIAARMIVIQVYQNYSPCSQCAGTIARYITGMRLLKKKVEMNITFANFYKTHEYPGNCRQNAERNIKGLKRLVKYGVELEVFGEHEECQKWESFLEMTEFFVLSEEDKRECVRRARLPERKCREAKDKEFLQKKVYVEDSQPPEGQMAGLTLSSESDVEYKTSYGE